eukprot:5473495-Pyramimonas_sp.AAC.1
MLSKKPMKFLVLSPKSSRIRPVISKDREHVFQDTMANLASNSYGRNQDLSMLVDDEEEEEEVEEEPSELELLSVSSLSEEAHGLRAAAPAASKRPTGSSRLPDP